MLTTNMIACSQVNVERLLRRGLEEQSDEDGSSALSSLSSGSLSLTDKESWEQIRKKLQSVGLTPRAFDKNRAFILQILEQSIFEGDFVAAIEPGSQSKRSLNASIDSESTAALTLAPAMIPKSRVNQPPLPMPIKTERNRERPTPVTSKPAKRPNGLSRIVYRLATSRNKFIQAAADGDLPLVMRGLDMNVDVDYQNPDGDSVSIKAADNGHERIVEALVAHGAARRASIGTRLDCNAALCRAAAKGHVRIIELILEEGGMTEWCPELENSSSRPASPLYMAASSGQLSAVQVLLKKGASLETLHGNGESEALLTVSAHGFENIVRYLLEKGARIDGSTSEGKTALSYAITHQRDSIVALLLSKGASVDIKDKELRTYLYLALADKLDADVKGSKQLGIVKALLEYGAKATINAIDKQQETALLLAITQ
ncbi:uncharacterized protein N7483_000100 [Penicillium malachiteum]|uniref:uncharacterized protein n=1 Tax=Penicillium malachiteum TaxID=1324776 RepID=UPI0025474867|nr:uncharacterized protein N7483_000100 [Penicillium malachiteum]KAJ5734975.1 hypothetical protein N7483_000100 [Penicillium malachiteum]